MEWLEYSYCKYEMNVWKSAGLVSSESVGISYFPIFFLKSIANVGELRQTKENEDTKSDLPYFVCARE